ncbi:flagellar biosynthetic protein FliO [Natribacillus halophilus]|uniref:Flagellar protein FliO/FliZ n=1 Tax=Natribacillus halophilus TaxID=549003 RepID=A0A1G8PPG1_9BACI|nr:flagellar biosynthetic protein FliO [Natribacillus halophilus]SDI94095.1 flagellar protein FliO/FliZ [Natribacillus halophilus]
MKICNARLAVCMMMFLVFCLPHPVAADDSVLDSLNESNDGVVSDEGEGGSEGMGTSEEQSVWSVLFQLGLALAAVILVMFVLLKILANRTNRFQTTKTMQNLGGIGLGNQKSVQLIRVGDRLLVVGVGQSIQLLQEINDEQEAKALKALAESQQTSDFTSKTLALWKGEKAEENDAKQVYARLERQMHEVKQHKEAGFNHLEGRK